MSYRQKLSEHRRLTILKFLAEMGEYTSNASILTDVCTGYGVTSTRDQVVSDLEWMCEQQLVNLDGEGDFVIATATARGLDVAEGKVTVTGVKRPRPGV